MKTNKEITVKTKYKPGELVTHRLGTDHMMIVSLQINIDKTYTYGCSDKEGNWKWFKEYEITRAKELKIKGFTIKLK